MRKRLLSAALALLLLFSLTACGLFARLDTSAWRYYRLEALGVAVLLPDDVVRDAAADELFRAQNAELSLTVAACDELYPDAETMAAALADDAEQPASVGDASLLQLSAEERSAEYAVFSPDGDAYRLRLAVDETVKRRRAEALLSAVSASLCGVTEVPDGAAVVRVPAPERKGVPDPLVLVNARHALPEGWADALDLVTTANADGAPIPIERTVCKAYFALRRALAARGVTLSLDAAYGDEGEHPTGLALDLHPMGAEAWETLRQALAAHGFILRYPEGGAYETGHEPEPWHIRYVGVDAAREIDARGVTLEACLGELPAAIDYLVLVNATHALPDGWEDAVEIVHMTNRHEEDVGVERVAYEAYCRLRDALAEDGVHLDINSAYRTVAEQRALAERYTRQYGEAYVKAYVAVPGYSEHHTGLAIDLYLESVDVWAKIHARLAEFGFILRYPEGGEAITGYAYEPWHVRFVGVEKAQEITGQALTLEEYLNEA